jgi:hypothetical protein
MRTRGAIIAAETIRESERPRTRIARLLVVGPRELISKRALKFDN